MSNQSRESILRQRVSQLLTEYEKTAAYIEDSTSTAKKSLDLFNDIKNEFYSKQFKKTLQKLDEIIYTIIDFNDLMEEKKIHNIFEEINNYSNNQLTTPVKLENEEIDDTLPPEYIEDKIYVPRVRLICPIDDDDDSSEEINNTANINENEIESPLPDNSVFEKSLTVQKYSKNDEFECVIIHVENPWCIYVVPKDRINDYQCFLAMICNHDYSKVDFANKQELLNSKQSCFMYFDNIVATWCRVVINNTLPDQIDCIEVLSVDTGRKFTTNIDDLYILKKQLLSCNRYLIEVKLNLVQPLENSNRQWSNECIEYLEKFEFKECFVTVEKVLKDSLLVLMSYDKNDLSLDITLNHFAQFYGGDVENLSACDLETSSVTENIQTASNDILFNKNIGPDIDVKFDNLNLNDEKLLCKLYKGPPDTTCFKGDRCKKIHKVFNKDCWTVERVPIKLIAKIDLPNPNSVVKLLVTSVKSCTNIYVQLLSVKNATEYDIDYNNLQKKFQTLVSSMNKQSNISSMKNFEYSPAKGEFVAAKFNKNTWQRAKVIFANPNSVELIFIDYGIYSEVHISDVRKLSPEYFRIPQQAVECIIVNVKEEYQDKVAKARSCISDMILNKSLTAEVKCAEEANGLLQIILFDEDGFDVAGMLHALELIEIDNSYNDKFQNTDKDSYEVQFIPG